MLNLFTLRPEVRFRHAFRVALAVVIAYYIALLLGWQSPHWAGLAIATVSALTDLSESLAKGRNRILGTLLAAGVALLLLGLFYQDRWPMLVCMALWLSVCTYRMGGSAHSYFWLVAGFVVPIIALRTGPHGSATAFLAAVERTQETLMGICVYMLVSLFVWPEKAEAKATREDNAPAGEKQPAVSEEKDATGAATPQPAWFFPDPDRLVGAIYVFATFCLGGLLVFYVPAFPNGGFVLAMLPSVCMAVATTPFAPLRIVYRPLMVNIILGTAIVVLVLPHLTSFPQLAALLFVMTFGIGYHFFDPAAAIARAIGLPFFLVMLHVSNVQQHDFLYTANLATMMLVAMLILLVTDHFPVSRRPEKRLLWQLRRFERSASYLAENREQSAGPLSRYRREYHRYEVATLPENLVFWRGHIPPQVLSDNAARLDQLLADIDAISERLLRDEDVRESLAALGSDRQALCAGTLAQPRFL